MNLQRQPNQWSCLPTAFAMALGVPVEDLIQQVGHDGSIKLSGLKPPYCYRGFHAQELINCAWRLGFTVTTFEAYPRIAGWFGANLHTINNTETLKAALNGQPGVLTGETLTGKRHAVAWDGAMILDPNGQTYGADRFKIECFYAVRPFDTNAIMN